MNRTKPWISLAVVAGYVMLLLGSADIPVSEEQRHIIEPCVSGRPVMIGQFAVSITDVQWGVNSVMVTLRIMNKANTPLAWNIYGRYVRHFALINAQGTRYGDTSQGSIYMKTAGNLNPGMEKQGYAEIEAPQGNYTFKILEERPIAPDLVKDFVLYECSISS